MRNKSISQCVNANSIECFNVSDSEAGGLVGRMYDRGMMYDCLNTGYFPSKGGNFIGHADNEVVVSNCLTLTNDTYSVLINKSGATCKFNNLYFYSTDDYNEPLGTMLSASEVGNPNSYNNWNIGNSSETWTIPTLSSGYSFPVPFTSEMTK